MRLRFLVLPFALGLTACAAAPDESEATDDVHEQAEPWDSAAGNPTHPTHTWLAEIALDVLTADHPELSTYRSQVIEGANKELHDLVLQDPGLEQLRKDFGGDNAGCTHPEVVWQYAKYWYHHGRKDWAYWYLGALLHYVQDMGVPAHGFHVWHQSGIKTWDHFEVLAFQNWAPKYDEINRNNPGYADPSKYVGFSGSWSTGDFSDAWPGVTYDREFFSKTWVFASKKERTFVKNREGRTAAATIWALQSAVMNWDT